MPIFSQSSNIKGSSQSAIENLTESVLAIPDIVGLWMPDPLYVSGVADQSVANRVESTGALGPITEQPAFSNVLFGSSFLPPRGLVRQTMYFNGSSAVMAFQEGDFPTGADAVWTKVVIFRADMIHGIGTTQNGEIWRSQQGSIGSHRLYVDGPKVKSQVRGVATAVTTDDERYSPGCYNYVINSYDTVTQKLSLLLNGISLQEKTGSGAEIVTSNFSYLGGNNDGGSFAGHIALAALFLGDLLAIDRETDLETVKRLCEFSIGVRNAGE